MKNIRTAVVIREFYPTLKIGIIVVVAIIDIAVGPGGGFGGPGGGFSGNRSSGKPLLLLKLKNHPQDHQNHYQDHQDHRLVLWVVYYTRSFR